MYHTFESSKSQPTDSPENVEQIVKKLEKSIFFHLIYMETQESVLSHTYAFKIVNSTSFLPAPSTLAKQESLLVRVRIVCTKCFCLIGNSS